MSFSMKFLYPLEQSRSKFSTSFFKSTFSKKDKSMPEFEMYLSKDFKKLSLLLITIFLFFLYNKATFSIFKKFN